MVNQNLEYNHISTEIKNYIKENKLSNQLRYFDILNLDSDNIMGNQEGSVDMQIPSE
jgi:hypothetical protein